MPFLQIDRELLRQLVDSVRLLSAVVKEQSEKIDISEQLKAVLDALNEIKGQFECGPTQEAIDAVAADIKKEHRDLSAAVKTNIPPS